MRVLNAFTSASPRTNGVAAICGHITGDDDAAASEPRETTAGFMASASMNVPPPWSTASKWPLGSCSVDGTGAVRIISLVERK